MQEIHNGVATGCGSEWKESRRRLHQALAHEAITADPGQEHSPSRAWSLKDYADVEYLRRIESLPSRMVDETDMSLETDIRLVELFAKAAGIQLDNVYYQAKLLIGDSEDEVEARYNSLSAPPNPTRLPRLTDERLTTDDIAITRDLIIGSDELVSRVAQRLAARIKSPRLVSLLEKHLSSRSAQIRVESAITLLKMSNAPSERYMSWLYSTDMALCHASAIFMARVEYDYSKDKVRIARLLREHPDDTIRANYGEGLRPTGRDFESPPPAEYWGCTSCDQRNDCSSYGCSRCGKHI